MAMAPIRIERGEVDAQSKQSRPDRAVTLDLHALGLFTLDGVALPQWVRVPPIEPGSLLEVVTLNGRVVLDVLDERAPTLMAGPVLLVCDSAGSEGEVAMAVLMSN